MNKPIALLAICLTLPLFSWGEESAIDKMFKVMAMDKQMAAGFDAMLPLVDRLANNLKLNQDQKAELITVYRNWYQEDIDHEKIQNEVKAAYTQAFSEKEIIEITRFYQTPIGQKYLNTSPKLVKIGAQIGFQEAQSKQTELKERVKPFLTKHNIK